jgi:hypothetical protein
MKWFRWFRAAPDGARIFAEAQKCTTADGLPYLSFDRALSSAEWSALHDWMNGLGAQTFAELRQQFPPQTTHPEASTQPADLAVKAAGGGQ